MLLCSGECVGGKMTHNLVLRDCQSRMWRNESLVNPSAWLCLELVGVFWRRGSVPAVAQSKLSFRRLLEAVRKVYCADVWSQKDCRRQSTFWRLLLPTLFELQMLDSSCIPNYFCSTGNTLFLHVSDGPGFVYTCLRRPGFCFYLSQTALALFLCSLLVLNRLTTVFWRCAR
jgi:hypothetical protein